MDVHLRRVGFAPRAVAVEEDDGAVELNLGLSVGGSSREAGRVAGGAPPLRRRDAGCGEAEADPGRSGASVLSSSTPPPPLLPFLQGGLDPLRRREMHAQRRQEARMKRQEKQQKKGIGRAGRDGAASGAAAGPGLHCVAPPPPPEVACPADERVAMEAQTQRSRARDREAREEESQHSDRRSGEHHEAGSDFVRKSGFCPIANANPSADANLNPSFGPKFCNPGIPPFGAHPLPAMALQYPYPHVQYLPFANGFGLPYMIPFWPPGMSPFAGAPGAATNVFQPVACQAFRPSSPQLVDPTIGVPSIGRKEADSGSGKEDTRMKRAPLLTGSLGSNRSSAISDHESNPLQGENRSSSGDSRSHSNNAPVERPQPQLSPPESSTLLLQGMPEHSISSRQVETEPQRHSAGDRYGKSSPSTSVQHGALKGDPSCSHPRTPELEGSASVDKPASAAEEPSAAPSPQASSPLSCMPCVATTGDGPDGKTITGFLYRYTSAEVSIVCVCHGSCFSPAEFVKHAGGTDTGNPLRHIVVVSS